MTRRSIPCVFMRGGTSRALMFHERDLPASRDDWAPIFLRAMGSPDPYGRQLDGMGGGVSSLSKVCVVERSARSGADLDYTFVQVLVDQPRIDTRGNCGNMLAAVGPFAVDEELLPIEGDAASLVIHNTNTGKLIRSQFPLRGGRAREDGRLSIPGVAGTGAAIRLDFLSPGGATTGRLLPTGRVRDRIGDLEVSLVDAGNATVFVRAADLGLAGTELPHAIDSDKALMARLRALRIDASLAMGIAKTRDEAERIVVVPYVGIVSPPQPAHTLDGTQLAPGAMDLGARVIASLQPHRALPLTVALCTAIAARIEGTLVHDVARATEPSAPIRLGMPSGVLTVGAEVARRDGEWEAVAGSFYRTARRLFEGRVCL